ncbi:MAG: excinuclease ABC subunit UvrA [Bacteroidota bacterium]|nr:excinuclease ABC subunit UvrA [Bacteroidota bacterium]
MKNSVKRKTNNKNIVIRGARVHNLKNINLELPRNKLIVFTGVSGSGKSSLVFDTIYAEGQRRFVESLSSYARQFLERMDKPDVDFIEGLSPAIAIEQRTTTRNPRSTIGTSTEIYDYFRIFFARVGKTYCYSCGKLVQKDSVQTVLEKLNTETRGKDEVKLYIMFPLQLHPKATVKQEIENLKKQGFIRLFCKGQLIELNEKLPPKICKSDISVVIDRIMYRKIEAHNRIADSVETAFNVSGGHAIIRLVEEEKDIRFNQHFNCADCGIDYETPDPRLFSFNSPFGACPVCQGFGRSIGIDLNLVIPDKTKSISQGAILPWTTPKWKKYLNDLMEVANEYDIRVDVPFFELTEKEIDLVLNGSRDFDGVYDFFKYIERKSYKIHYRYFLSRFRGYTTCETCKGSRLRKEATYVKIEGKSIFEIVQMTVTEAYDFFDNLKLTEFELEIAKRVLAEIKRRLKYLVDIGVSYLSLDRLTSTLSGGESQRINLATSLGSSLVGSMYVLDEPSIGLHPRDNNKLINILKSLRDVGNTVIVVEHDADMMRTADTIVDLGPGAGDNGGKIVFTGTYNEIRKSESSLTGKYLAGELEIALPVKRRKGTTKKLIINGASQHNLKSIDVEIPLNKFVCITGVSGSGKSTLVMDVLYSALKKLKQSTLREETEYEVGKVQSISGAEFVNDVELVDQSPIGRTPRSNPATYIKIFDVIRDLFSKTQSAKIHGYTPGHFSFNVPLGRCDACEGSGVQIIEMQFLADLELTCDICKGKRFKKEILEIKYRGKTIHDVLNMTVTEAISFFIYDPAARRAIKQLKILNEVGLGYLRLGQSATTLSGGEAQRIKLAAHLTEQEISGNKLFIFDEPTTGLHFDDISKLLKCFDTLVENGNSVLIIEHNMDVIKCADWIIDLGPEAGNEGGYVVAAGTPEEISQNESSHTGNILKNYL